MLTSLIIKIFVRNSDHPERPEVRLAYGSLTGIVGIAVNLLLVAVKLTIGVITGSVAVAADAVNNLSDAGSAIITIIGFKLSARPPDNEHPFGHGRIEYVAGVILAVIILAVGFNFLKESVMRILKPEPLRIAPLLMAIFAGTMLFKFWLFLFYRNIAIRIDSKVIRAAAFDSLSDLFSSAVVLAAIACARFTDFPVDGCAGIAVAVLVLIGGGGILKEAISPLLGESADREFAEQLRTRLLQCHGIRGVHDIIIHNYGPGMYFATAHAEVDCNGDLVTMHDVLEAAEVEIGRTMPVRLLLHCDPFDTSDPKVKVWRARCENAVSEFDPGFKLYDFRLDDSGKPPILSFHLLIPRNYGLSGDEITAELTNKLAVFAPGVRLHIVFIHAYTAQ